MIIRLLSRYQGLSNCIKYRQHKVYKKLDVVHVIQFQVGQLISAKWSDKRFYPATITAFQAGRPMHVVVVFVDIFVLEGLYFYLIFLMSVSHQILVIIYITNYITDIHIITFKHLLVDIVDCKFTSTSFEQLTKKRLHSKNVFSFCY